MPIPVMQVLEDADDESNAVEFRNSQKATRFEPEEFSVNVSGTDRPFGVDTTNPNASKLGLPNLLPAIGESGEGNFYDYNSFLAYIELIQLQMSIIITLKSVIVVLVGHFSKLSIRLNYC